MAIYLNSVKVKEGKYGFKVSANVDKLIEELQANKNEKGYINLDLVKRKEPSQYGETHYFKVDDWKPTQPAATASPANSVATDKDDLPF